MLMHLFAQKRLVRTRRGLVKEMTILFSQSAVVAGDKTFVDVGTGSQRVVGISFVSELAGVDTLVGSFCVSATFAVTA